MLMTSLILFENLPLTEGRRREKRNTAVCDGEPVLYFIISFLEDGGVMRPSRSREN